MSEWIETTVGEYIPFTYGKNLPKDIRMNGSVNVYGSNGIVDSHKESCVNSAGIIIGRKGSVGAVHLSKESFWPIDTTFYIQKNDINELIFDYYILKSLGLEDMNSDSAVPGLNRDNAHALKIKIPTEKKSRIAIGKWLSKFDNKIENNQRMNKTLEAMAQAIFKSWFVDFEPVYAKAEVLENGGSLESANLAAMKAISGKTETELQQLKTKDQKKYNELMCTAKAFPSHFISSTLGDIPQGWEVKQIDDCYNVVMGQSPKGETYNENEIGTLFYQGRAEFGWRFPTPRLHTTAPKKMAKAGDVLMSVRAPVGDMNIALNDCCIGRGLSALRHKNNSTTFSYYQLHYLKSIFENFNGEGTVFGSINQNDLKKTLVIEPDKNTQNFYIDKCSALDKKILSLSLENQTLATIRDALLPKLLNGEIDLSYFNEASINGEH